MEPPAGAGHLAPAVRGKAKGVEVIATASGEAAGFVRSLGADRVIDYKTQDFEKDVRDVDVVFDLIGGETQARSRNALKDGGALISTLNEPSQARAKQKNARAARYTAQPDGRQLAQIADLIDREKVRVCVSRVFELAQMERAQRQLQEGHNRGKLVVTLSSRAEQNNAGA